MKMQFFLNGKEFTRKEVFKQRAPWSVDWMIREAMKLHRLIGRGEAVDDYHFQLRDEHERLSDDVLLIRIIAE